MALTGKDIQVLYHEIPFTSYLDSVDVNRERPALETTTFGDGSRTYVKGQRTGTMSFGGFYEDVPIDAVDSDYDGEGSAGQPLVSVTCGTTAGSRSYMMFGEETAVNISGSVTELMRMDVELSAETNAIDQGCLLFPLTTATTVTDADGATFDRGAGATSPGGFVAFLHVTAISGTSLAVTVEGDTDAAMGSPTSLTTFTTVTAGGGATAARKEVSTTVERYIRITYTIVGSATFAVTFASRQYTDDL
jgi:hypothetical protein